MTPTPAQRDALTRIADEFAGLAHQIRALAQPETPAQDAHTPREQPQTRSGGTESGDEPFVAASALGDKLRALGARFQHGVSNPDPANDEDIELNGYAYWATVQGIEALAAEADGMTAERDEWKRRRDAAVQECRFLHQDGLSRHDWHAKHCGAVEAADALRAQVERVRALVTESGPNVSCGGLSVTDSGCYAGDLARRLLSALDNGEKGV